ATPRWRSPSRPSAAARRTPRSWPGSTRAARSCSGRWPRSPTWPPPPGRRSPTPGRRPCRRRRSAHRWPSCTPSSGTTCPAAFRRCTGPSTSAWPARSGASPARSPGWRAGCASPTAASRTWPPCRCWPTRSRRRCSTSVSAPAPSPPGCRRWSSRCTCGAGPPPAGSPPASGPSSSATATSRRTGSCGTRPAGWWRCRASWRSRGGSGRRERRRRDPGLALGSAPRPPDGQVAGRGPLRALGVVAEEAGTGLVGQDDLGRTGRRPVVLGRLGGGLGGGRDTASWRELDEVHLARRRVGLVAAVGGKLRLVDLGGTGGGPFGGAAPHCGQGVGQHLAHTGQAVEDPALGRFDLGQPGVGAGDAFGGVAAGVGQDLLGLPFGLGPEHVGFHPGVVDDPPGLGAGAAELLLGLGPDALGLDVGVLLHLLGRLGRRLQDLADLLGQLPVVLLLLLLLLPRHFHHACPPADADRRSPRASIRRGRDNSCQLPRKV